MYLFYKACLKLRILLIGFDVKTEPASDHDGLNAVITPKPRWFWQKRNNEGE